MLWWYFLFARRKILWEQECIPVGYVPPALCHTRGGFLSMEVSVLEGGVLSGRPPQTETSSPADRMTHASKNITLPGLRKVINSDTILTASPEGFQNQNITRRLHSSRMHTTHSLTVSPNMHCAGGFCYRGRLLPEGVSAPRGCLVQGWGCGIPTCTEADPPPLWTEFLTHAYENIT